MGIDDTIFAYSSGEGVAGVAVLRISGSACAVVLGAMAEGTGVARVARFLRLRHPESGEVLDHGLVLWFPGPASFTGEDCVEFHTHGSLAVKSAVLDALSRIEGCRPAVPGEFTRRAFENGKLDLIGVEALSDLLDSRTDRQRQQALGLLGGRLYERAECWRRDILKVLGSLEASIDFVDEGDAPQDYTREIENVLGPVIESMEDALHGARAGEIVRDGFRIALCGRPNAGKSTLLNWLARRDVAIVSEVAGTTRDVIEVSLDIKGLLLVVSDTAGIQETRDAVEGLGIDRSRKSALAADLVLWLWETGCRSDVDNQIAEESRDIVSVETKVDRSSSFISTGAGGLRISVAADIGLGALIELFREKALVQVSGKEAGLMVHARHKREVQAALSALMRCVADLNGRPAEILAEELRDAAFHIGAISGKIGTEDVLGEIFSRFCMGK